MFMVAASVVTTILILNYHHRKTETHEMPMWVSVDQSQASIQVTNQKCGRVQSSMNPVNFWPVQF